MRNSNVNKWASSPDLLIFSQFHRHILENQTVLIPTTFISAPEKIGVGLKNILENQTVLIPTTFISTPEKIGVGLKKQAANFLFNFIPRRVVRYSCFDFFPVQNEGVFSHLGYEIFI